MTDLPPIPAPSTDAPPPPPPPPPSPAPAPPAPPAPTPPNAAPTRSGSPRVLTQQVLKLANQVHGVVGRLGRHELAERLAAQADRWGEPSLTVIFAGDIKRGKSSLLNAVLGRTGLLPVDADVATAVHLVVRYGENEQVRVHRHGENGEVETEELGVDQLVDVASMKGSAARRDGVTEVEVLLPQPELERGLVLIDTPGVGGMTRGHQDITMAALQRADVLVFTLSAQEPIARSELAFLAEATDRIDTVVLALTKADLNDDDLNNRMVADLRDRLRAYRAELAEAAAGGDERARDLGNRFARLIDAPVLVTSAYLAEQAAVRHAAGRTEQADRLDARSGLDPLRRFLDVTLDRREEVRLANLCRLLDLVLADVESALRDTLGAISDDSTVGEQLTVKRAEIEALASQQARWRSTLAGAIQRLNTEIGRTINRELNVVRYQYRSYLGQAKDLDHLQATILDDLERSVQASWNNLSAIAEREFALMLGKVLEDLRLDGQAITLGDLDAPSSLREVMTRTVDQTHEFTLLDDGLPLTMQTYTFGNIANATLTGLAGALGIASGGLGILAYGVGASIAYPLMRARRKQKERAKTVQEFQLIVNEVLLGSEGVAKEFQTEFGLRMIERREQFERFVDERLSERRRLLEDQSREVQQLMKADAASRQRVRAQTDASLAEVVEAAKQNTALSTQVTRRLQQTLPTAGTLTPPTASHQ